MKDPKVERGPRVRRDLLWIFTQFGQTSERNADQFLLTAERTFRQIAEMPGMGELYDPEDDQLGPIRRCRMTRFRSYLVYYVPIEGGIKVLRVIHAAREPRDLIEPEDFD